MYAKKKFELYLKLRHVILEILTPETMKLLGRTEKKLKIEMEKVCLITKLIN